MLHNPIFWTVLVILIIIAVIVYRRIHGSNDYTKYMHIGNEDDKGDNHPK